MKNLIFVFCLWISAAAFAQTDRQGNTFCQCNGNVVFRLYPMEFQGKFIKLDTRNGRMWQVNSGRNGTTILNDQSLLSPGEQEKNGRFHLLSTSIVYKWVLLDQKNGRIWNVDASLKKKEQKITLIAEDDS